MERCLNRWSVTGGIVSPRKSGFRRAPRLDTVGPMPRTPSKPTMSRGAEATAIGIPLMESSSVKANESSNIVPIDTNRRYFQLMIVVCHTLEGAAISVIDRHKLSSVNASEAHVHTVGAHPCDRARALDNQAVFNNTLATACFLG
jgi:hypothetical protein